MASGVRALKCRWHSPKETARPEPPHGGTRVPDEAGGEPPQWDALPLGKRQGPCGGGGLGACISID